MSNDLLMASDTSSICLVLVDLSIALDTGAPQHSAEETRGRYWPESLGLLQVSGLQSRPDHLGKALRDAFTYDFRL